MVDEQMDEFQACNQEIFRAGEFSSNWGTLINIHLQHEKERLFHRETLKNFISNEKFYP